MDDGVKRLEERGLQTRKVDIDTDASVKANAKAIRDAILEASSGGKKVVLVGHSKGGVDAAAALAMYPELKPHVRALVAMQSPYGGTPISSDVQTCPDVKAFADHVLTGAFKGDPASLADLSYETRQEFVRQYPYPTDIPTVSLATTSTHPLSLTGSAQGLHSGSIWRGLGRAGPGQGR